MYPSVRRAVVGLRLWLHPLQVEGAQFADAIAEALEPRMRLTGEMATLDKFKQFFDGRTLEKGTQVSHPAATLAPGRPYSSYIW